MDLNTVISVVRPQARLEIPAFQVGDVILAGGTWLFSEPQDHARRLIDLTSLAWPDFSVHDAGLEVSATCTLASLGAFPAPPGWQAVRLFPLLVDTLLGSFKIRQAATVGGNLCLALAAAPMAALAVALHAVCTIWRGSEETSVPASALITGAGRTCLLPGDILRGLLLPAPMLRRRAVMRQMSLTPLGRSASLVIGTWRREDFELTIAAATEKPVLLRFPAVPAKPALSEAIERVVPVWFDDIHGRPAWRRQITHRLAAEICDEIAAA